MKYFKLLILNLFVASILVLALTGTSKADGLDDPKFYAEQAPKKARNYGQLFDWCMSSQFNNMSSKCRIYDDMGPFNWPHVVIDIPTNVIRVEQPVDVPEPEQALLLVFGLLMLRWYKVCAK